MTSGVDNVRGLPGTVSDVYYYSIGAGGGFLTSDNAINVGGAADYSGTDSAPVFSAGTYLTVSPVGTLVISAPASTPAPEPVSVALMATGLLGLGAAHSRASSRG